MDEIDWRLEGNASNPVNWVDLSARARSGSAEAMEALVGHLQRPVFNLALRYLKYTELAEDATQDILIRVVTNLSSYRGESSFPTWVYRIAVNHLLNLKLRDKHRRVTTFSELGERLVEGLSHVDEDLSARLADAELEQEVKRSCTLGMLQCLDDKDRMTLILAEVLGVSSAVGADIMSVSAPAFRKRLERARNLLIAFVADRCGIVNPGSPCRCHRHAARMRRGNLRYQGANRISNEADAICNDATRDTSERVIALMCAHPSYRANTDYVSAIRRLLSPHRSSSAGLSTDHPANMKA